jgi:hypothetical protein
LISFKPATKFYGLKLLDPRTVRMQIHPQKFDYDTAETYTEKYIQRRLAGPLAPTADAYGMTEQVEIDIHPDQMLKFQFNKVGGGIYGYSLMRETLFALKGYMLMQQFLPTIVYRRADPGLQFQFGGPVLTQGKEDTMIMKDTEIEAESTRYKNRMPGQDVYSSSMLNIKEIYQHMPTLEGITELIRIYKERVLMGLGTPMSTAVLSAAGAEVKWGALNFAVLEEEVEEYHQDMEPSINSLMPMLHPSTPGVEATFNFNPVHQEDWRADAAALLPLLDKKVITIDYMLQRLNMLPEDAQQGKFYEPPAPVMGGFGKNGNGKPDKDAENPKRQKPTERKEKWRIRDTEEGVIAERYDAN